jgi:hypothetical protein
MCYHLHSESRFSLHSRPPAAADANYEIHLVKSDDPDYIPADMEVWPIYHSAILAALHNFPEARSAAVAAFKQKQQEIKGRENRDAPRGSRRF